VCVSECETDSERSSKLNQPGDVGNVEAEAGARQTVGDVGRVKCLR